MNTNTINMQPYCQMLTPEQWELLTTSPYATIYDLINLGENCAVSASTICQYIHASERTLRNHIRAMRRAGIVIVSGNSGYWLPETAAELQRYIERTESGAKDELYTLRHARKALKVQEAEYAKII